MGACFGGGGQALASVVGVVVARVTSAGAVSTGLTWSASLVEAAAGAAMAVVEAAMEAAVETAAVVAVEAAEVALGAAVVLGCPAVLLWP